MLSINIEAFWVSLLGFWLSYSLATFGICCTRVHWFVKFLTIAGLAGVLLFIDAPDLMLIVLAQCLTIFLMLAAGKTWTARRATRDEPNGEQAAARLPQVGLLNAMLGVATLCILLSAVQVDLFEHLPLVYSVLFGASLGVVSVLAFWLAKVERWWVGVLVAMACVVGAIAIPKIIFRPPPTGLIKAFQWAIEAAFGRYVIWGELSDFAISILIANAIAIVLLCVSWRLSRSNRVWIKRVAQTAGVLMIAAMILLSAGTVHLYSGLLNGPRVDWPVQQNDQVNGFDALVTAGKRFDESRILIDPKIASARVGLTLKQELQNYSNEFEQAERALRRPLLTSAISSIDEYDSMREEVHALRRTALAFQCRSIQHLHEGDVDSAIADACLIAESSVPLRRDRTITNELMALVIEVTGHFQAIRCIQAASPDSLRLAMSRLAAIAPADQYFKDLYENDYAIEWANSRWQGRLKLLIENEELKQHYESYLPLAGRFLCANRRQVGTLMAIELFRRKENRYPADLKSLVPTFLDSVPLDPFLSTAAQKPLVYRLSEDGSSFELYSVGANLVDDNGKLNEVGTFWEKGDVNLTAKIKYEEATTDAERKELTIPEP